MWSKSSSRTPRRSPGSVRGAGEGDMLQCAPGHLTEFLIAAQVKPCESPHHFSAGVHEF
ncbi:hypothetical protein GLX28_03525 [Deinococcus xianganensis]|uniref:Uncharacterized protein n=1 Tax=Deinococcus xianganensis TaxID=1507289 RepID=A0A6I4YCE2_9DEIO|nr:hypothetical protein [Deinococcus xianganensis]